MFRIGVILALGCLCCTQRQAREPSSEDRLLRALAEPAGPIAEPLTFEAPAGRRRGLLP